MSDERTKSAIELVNGVSALTQFSDADDSLQQVQQYVIVPFVKLIQPQTDDELKDAFGEGSAVLRPGNGLLTKKDGSFKFVPLFFYTQYRKWADREDPKQMIVESTYDPESLLAQKSRDPNRWDEPYADGSGMTYRYVEHLVFVGIVHGDHELRGTKCVISFQKGDYKSGKEFCSSIAMRKFTDENGKRKNVPLWAQIWEMTISKKKNTSGSWWSFSPEAPDGSSIIEPELFNEYAGEYAAMKEAFAKNLLKVEGDDSGVDEQENAADTKEF